MMTTDTLGTNGTIRTRTPYSVVTVPDPGSMARRSRPQQTRFRVDGLTCATDANRLEHRLARQAGVIGVCVNQINDYAYIAFDPTMTSPSLLQRQIEVFGYRAMQR
jgi:hypothetical protein